MPTFVNRPNVRTTNDGNDVVINVASVDTARAAAVDVVLVQHHGDGQRRDSRRCQHGPELARRVTLGACLVMLLAGCTSSGGSDQRGRTPSSSPSTALSVNDVSCATSIQSASDPPDNYRVVAPGVAVPTAPVLQASDTRETDRTLRLFAKWGLVVRTDTVADLQVGPGWEDRARIQWGWGTRASPGVAVHVPACPQPAGQTQWLAFAGGTWVAQPACVPLVVRSQGQEAQVRLGIGMACGDGSGP